METGRIGGDDPFKYEGVRGCQDESKWVNSTRRDSLPRQITCPVAETLLRGVY